MKQPGVWTGALVGLIATAPLIIISTLAYQLAGLPFFVIDLFNFAVKVLPGPLVNFGKDTMAKTLVALNFGRLDAVAKTTEQAIGVAQMLGIGIVVAAVFFLVLRGHPNKSAGWLLGLIMGLVVAWISATTLPPTATTGPLISVAWNVIAFVVWGWFINWVQMRLSEPDPVAAVPVTASR
jgi:hypothetical protein